MEIDESLQRDGRKTWMLRDIFLKCGIIDRNGNLYEGPDCDTDIYQYCYGTEIAALERGLKRQDEKKTEPKGISTFALLIRALNCFVLKKMLVQFK